MSYYTTGHYRYSNPYDGTYISTSNQCVARNNAKGMFIIRYNYSSSSNNYMYAVMSLNGPITYNPENSAEGNFDMWASQNKIAWSNSSNTRDGSDAPFPTDAGSQYVIDSWQGLGRRYYGKANQTSRHCLYDVDFPIFNYNDQEGINKYVNSGDDSNATNYDELHPTTLHISMYFDGNSYPNIFIKGVDENNRISTFHYLAEGSNLGLLYNTSSNGDLNVNTMNNFTYGEIFNDYKKGRIVFTCEELRTNPGALVDDTQVSLSWNGSEYSIEQATSNNGRVTLDATYGVPSDDDYPDGGDDDNNPWQDTDSTNSFTGANKLTNTYRLIVDDNTNQLNSLGNFLWSSTFKQSVLDVCNYPMENVVAIKAMPIVEDGADKEIKIGNVATGITSKSIANADQIKIEVGNVFIPEYFKNFIDYQCVNLQIYLPFIGFKELDNLVCMNRRLYVTYIFDCLYGSCMAELKVKDINGKKMLYQAYQGNCGIDISLSATNRASIENGYINAGLNTISDVLTGNIAGAIGDVFNGATQDFHTQSTGAGNPSLMNRLSNLCYVIVRRPKKFTIANNYGHEFGFPLYEEKKLSTLTGYTECDNFICNISGMTEVEKAELKQLMESGVYIRNS